MSILGVIHGVIGALAALLAGLMGILSGIPAAVLGLLAVLFGFLARKKFGYIGLMMVSKTAEEDKIITEEVIALLKNELPKTAATETAEPAAETEAPAEETAQ